MRALTIGNMIGGFRDTKPEESTRPPTQEQREAAPWTE